jgi:hypothetical protein
VQSIVIKGPVPPIQKLEPGSGQVVDPFFLQQIGAESGRWAVLSLHKMESYCENQVAGLSSGNRVR